MFKVKKETLLLLACFVWAAAGYNVLRIGILSYPPYITAWNVLLSIVVFIIFTKFIFGKLVTKHTARIQHYTEARQFFLKFFDAKSFIIMAVMMTGGIAIRAFEIASTQFIAVFYSGLGAALLLAGILFGYNYGKAVFTVFNNEKEKGVYNT